MGYMDDIKNKRFCLVTGCLFALIFILLIYSPQNVDPGYTNWVINGGGDNLQHYLGWRFFRNSGWNRYLLFMQNLNYPVGTSVIVTDSNPLFCLIFKAIRNILPENFQFNGIWIICSYLLQAYFSTVILWQLTHKISLTVSGTFIAVMNPVILQRALIHDTLTAHWLLLAAIWLALNYNKKRNLPGWFILTELTLLIHIYFLPMIIFILVIQIIRMVIQKQSFLRIAALPAVFSLSLFVGYYLFGYSHVQAQSGSFGELSMNLNAFINPDTVPAFLKARETLPLQYEGFNYWGLGVLVLIFLGAVVGNKEFLRMILPYMLPAAALILLAASNKGYFDGHLVYHLELPDWVYSWLSVFRSSGRLVWCLYYLVLFAVLAVLAKRKDSNNILTAVVFACAFLQMVDFQVFFKDCADRFRNPENQIAAVPEEFIKILPENTVHLYSSEGDSKIVDAFALYAADHHMTFNKSANARGIKHNYGGDEIDLNSMTCQNVEPDSVYIFHTKVSFPENLMNCAGFDVTDLDGIKVVIRKK